jgi:hypothetical protein
MAKRQSSHQSGVLLDLNNPEFLNVFLRLESAELHQVAAALHRIQRLSWSEIHKAPGLKWEAVKHISGPNGQTVYSIRLSDKVRALAYRDGSFLRLLSLHPNHDSAYRR